MRVAPEDFRAFGADSPIAERRAFGAARDDSNVLWHSGILTDPRRSRNVRVRIRPFPAPMRVLLVEDDNMIGHSLRQALVESGLAVDWVRDGVVAQDALAQGGYAAVLLDLGLPRRSGFEVLRRARQDGDRTPMLVLTARDGLDDRVTGLDYGADDYLVKPFELRELLARMRAIIRRVAGHAQSAIGTAETQLDLSTRQLTHNGSCVELSAREFRLMHALLDRPGAIVSRTQLEERMYGWGEEVSSNAVEVLIHAVRRKVGADVIRNVRGLGWRVGKAQS
jgi:DNA-binding response OmpR family regulator